MLSRLVRITVLVGVNAVKTLANFNHSKYALGVSLMVSLLCDLVKSEFLLKTVSVLSYQFEIYISMNKSVFLIESCDFF